VQALFICSPSGSGLLKKEDLAGSGAGGDRFGIYATYSAGY